MKSLLLATLLAVNLAHAEVIKLDCPAKLGVVQTCYHLGNLNEAELGVTVKGSSCAKPSLRSTAPLYFQDTYIFTASDDSSVAVNLQARTTNKLRVALYTPTIAVDDISALANGAYPNYAFEALAAGQYVVTVKGVGTGVGSGVCGYTASFSVQ